ncbi:PREDICTED: uncharacterized protein LOC105451089 [Wasmannia auropunctata]|uniref:uncharacterized protein LOC105451089 n=1 Tax=Wasmannia auropunctata TaxID=64793 RepID=UPI0005EE8731|nr:PREDICTED: uncharacterized protein LOC105451089 [Wasmannia auropunctata]
MYQKMEELLNIYNMVVTKIRKQNDVFIEANKKINSLEMKSVSQDNITISRDILCFTSEMQNLFASSANNNAESMTKLIQLKVLTETIIREKPPVEGENPPSPNNP